MRGKQKVPRSWSESRILMEGRLMIMIYSDVRMRSRLSPQLIPIAAEYYQYGTQNDLQIQQQRPVFNIEQVETNHLCKR